MRKEQGFSLIELMVALVMTLIVSGAIYGLMASGQGSFKREPALIDRQQNIRVAMDTIVRDLEEAGSGMTGYIAPNTPNPGPPPLSQIFTPGLDNVGPAVGPLPSAILGGAEKPDALEFFMIDGSCPSLQICRPESTATNMWFKATAPLNGCMTGSFFAYVSGPNAVAPNKSFYANSLLTPGMMWVTGDTQSKTCESGSAATRVHVSAPAAGAWINDASNCTATSTSPCQSLVRVSRVRYELAGENPALPASFGPPTNPAALNVPCLWRSEYGRYNRDGTVNAGPYIGGPPPAAGQFPNNPWQMIARGIDDMQIDYQAGAVAFNAQLGMGPKTPPILPNVPPAAAPTNTDLVVRRVRVTLSARAIGVNLGGEAPYPTNLAGEIGRRGQLTTIVAPRPALATVAMDSDLTKNWR